jgi:hypothetical protein
MPDPDGKVAIIDLNRSDGKLRLLEGKGLDLAGPTQLLKQVSGEEAHLAICRASDFVVTRTAGGVLSGAETQRPSVLVDEPGHWLGNIQRDQCRDAGLCVVIPLADFLKDPGAAIQGQADQIGTGGGLDQIVNTAKRLELGAEVKLAQYLFDAYLK